MPPGCPEQSWAQVQAVERLPIGCPIGVQWGSPWLPRLCPISQLSAPPAALHSQLPHGWLLTHQSSARLSRSKGFSSLVLGSSSSSSAYCTAQERKDA